jgi:cyclin B
MVVVEHRILNRLKFNITFPTPYVFLVQFLKAAGPNKVMENLAFFLVELCLLHYTMIKYCPSMLLVVVVYTAQCTLRKDICWSKTLSLHTGYSEEYLKECAHFMVNFHMNAGRNKLRVVHRKYSIPFFWLCCFFSPCQLTW